jgi:hypothetical protein
MATFRRIKAASARYMPCYFLCVIMGAYVSMQALTGVPVA